MHFGPFVLEAAAARLSRDGRPDSMKRTNQTPPATVACKPADSIGALQQSGR